MSYYLIFGGSIGLATGLACCWLGWQLLRQNGRMLLRLDELEKRLNELEFGATDQPAGLSLDSVAPDFELPNLSGETKSLAQFRGQSVLLIFFNPACGFCRELLPRLVALDGQALQAPGKTKDPASNGEPHSVQSGSPHLLIITTGEAQTNRQLFTEHKLTCPVLFQKEMEVATAFEADGTPSGYLISREGRIASELAVGGEALLALATEQSEIRNQKSGIDKSASDSRAGRFTNRSLARSKIKRDGLKAGTPAPEFRLSRLDGRGELALSDLRGRRVLLVFSSPHCGPCNTLAPQLEKFHREQERKNVSPSRQASPSTDGQLAAAVQVVMISRGEPGENRAKVKEHNLTFPIVLQQQWEVSRLYAMFATPIAYLIDENGVIVHDVAVGTEPILNLMLKVVEHTPALRA